MAAEIIARQPIGQRIEGINRLLDHITKTEAQVETLTAEIRDLKSYIVKLRGKADPKEWRGIDAVTARAVLAEVENKALVARVGELEGTTYIDARRWKARAGELEKALTERALAAEAIIRGEDLGIYKLSRKIRAHLNVESRQARAALNEAKGEV